MKKIIALLMVFAIALCAVGCGKKDAKKQPAKLDLLPEIEHETGYMGEKNVAYIYTTLDEIKCYQTDLFGISRGMVSTMSDIKGVDIWVNFTETDKGVLCELRSSRYNINPVAVKYGGGGHAKASGATVRDRAEAMAMLADLDAMMEAAE